MVPGLLCAKSRLAQIIYGTPKCQHSTVALTGRLFEALGRVDDDVQEAIHPWRVIICEGEKSERVALEMLSGRGSLQDALTYNVWNVQNAKLPDHSIISTLFSCQKSLSHPQLL